MSSKISLYQVPVPSTQFMREADLCGDVIRFGYCKQELIYKGGIRFNRILATRTRAERCCTSWHIEIAYDTLVEVEESPWIEEMRAAIDVNWRDRWQMHHYMIYLDSVGCFEIIAESWEAIPEEPGKWE